MSCRYWFPLVGTMWDVREKVYLINIVQSVNVNLLEHQRTVLSVINVLMNLTITVYG